MHDRWFRDKRQFSHAGVEIPFYISGEGRESVVFFHGLGVSPHTYRTVITSLSRHYTVYAPQIPHFGTGRIPEKPWDFVDFARYFDAFLSDTVRSPVAVVGHSFGGGIALSLSALSSRVSACVSVNPAGVLDFSIWTFLSRLTVSAGLFCLGRPTLTRGIVADFALTAVRRLAVFGNIRETCVRSALSYGRFVASIRVPVLVVYSKNEELVPAPFQEYLRKNIQHVFWRQTDGYHNWVFDRPDECTSMVYDFLFSLKSGG